jgi:hypothetical protein
MKCIVQAKEQDTDQVTCILYLEFCKQSSSKCNENYEMHRSAKEAKIIER